MGSAVESMRARFAHEAAEADTSASDVVAACARMFGAEDAVEFLVSVVAREDNPCWLPQEAFEDVRDFVGGCRRRSVRHFVAAASPPKWWTPYTVAHF